MRITDSWIISDFLSSVNRTRERISRYNLQLANQKRLLRASDDPDAANSILRLGQDLSAVDRYKANVTDGKNSLKMAAASLDRIADIMQDVKGILSGAVSNTEPSLLGKFADQIDQFLDLSMEIANTQFDRKYIFGGTNTTTVPFTLNGNPQQAIYHGNAGAIQYQTGEGAFQVVNISGAAAFASTGAINLSGTLDRNAAINTTVTTQISVTDTFNQTHLVDVSLRKTGANTWSMTAGLPVGTTNATIMGGTTSITFDPVTGAIAGVTRSTPLVLSPAITPPATTAAPPVTLSLQVPGLSEQAANAVTGAHRQVSIFDKLIELRDKLRAGSLPDADDSYMIAMMQEVVMREEARAGAFTDSLSNADEYLVSEREHLLDLLGSKQQVDLAEIGMKLKQEEVMLDAALSVAARIIPRSLLDFLK
jgi:flagellar hook-associated protein 3